MKYRYVKAIFVLAIVAHLASCVVHAKNTDRKSPGHAKYRRNGRYW